MRLYVRFIADFSFSVIHHIQSYGDLCQMEKFWLSHFVVQEHVEFLQDMKNFLQFWTLLKIVTKSQWQIIRTLITCSKRDDIQWRERRRFSGENFPKWLIKKSSLFSDIDVRWEIFGVWVCSNFCYSKNKKQILTVGNSSAADLRDFGTNWLDFIFFWNQKNILRKIGISNVSAVQNISPW